MAMQKLVANGVMHEGGGGCVRWSNAFVTSLMGLDETGLNSAGKTARGRVALCLEAAWCVGGFLASFGWHLVGRGCTRRLEAG